MQKSPQPQAVWSPADFSGYGRLSPCFPQSPSRRYSRSWEPVQFPTSSATSPRRLPAEPHSCFYCPMRPAGRQTRNGCGFLRDRHPVGPEIKCSRCQKSSAQPTSQAVIPAFGNAPFVPVRLTAPRRGNTRPIPAAGRSWCASHPASSPDAEPTHRRCAPPAP